jgi:hypothetical protein
MVSGDRSLSSEYNRAVNYGVRDVVPRCERGRYIERRLLALNGRKQPSCRCRFIKVEQTSPFRWQSSDAACVRRR